MNIQIRKLTPDLAEDYANFFDETPHDDGTVKDELPCYCITWRSDDTYVDGDHWYPTREERRARAIQFIKAGKMRGYLAYHGDKIVGWCNTNENCRGGIDHLREFWPIEEHTADTKVKPIFCFVIAPEAKRMGVATKLVERVCQDAAADGFDFVEAYPYKEYVPLNHLGPLAMYEKCGFVKHAEQDGKVVVRKILNSSG